jgi:hypothetical protein
VGPQTRGAGRRLFMDARKRPVRLSHVKQNVEIVVRRQHISVLDLPPSVPTWLLFFTHVALFSRIDITRWSKRFAPTRTFDHPNLIPQTVQLIQHRRAAADTAGAVRAEPVAIWNAHQRRFEALHVPRSVALVTKQEGVARVLRAIAYLATVLFSAHTPEYGHNVPVTTRHFFVQERSLQQRKLVLFCFLLPLFLNFVATPR